MLALAAILLSVAGLARAEIGANCTRDSECQQNTEFCLLNSLKQQLLAGRAGGRATNQARLTLSALLTGEMGKCEAKMSLYQMCMFDNMCQTGLCLQGPIPGMKGLGLGTHEGRCVGCKNDNDCSSQSYCNHPVINAKCVESVLLGLSLKEEAPSSPLGGQRMVEVEDMDDDEEEDEQSVDFELLSQIIQAISSQQEKDSSRTSSNSRAQSFPSQSQSSTSRLARFPEFPSRRNKRQLSHFIINAPSMTCTPRKQVNSPCRRSGECQSEKCVMEGMCAI